MNINDIKVGDVLQWGSDTPPSLYDVTEVCVSSAGRRVKAKSRKYPSEDWLSFGDIERMQPYVEPKPEPRQPKVGEVWTHNGLDPREVIIVGDLDVVYKYSNGRYAAVRKDTFRTSFQPPKEPWEDLKPQEEWGFVTDGGYLRVLYGSPTGNLLGYTPRGRVLVTPIEGTWSVPNNKKK